VTETLEPPYDADEWRSKRGRPAARTSQLVAYGGGVSTAVNSPSNTFQVASCLGCGHSGLCSVRTDRIVDTFLATH